MTDIAASTETWCLAIQPAIGANAPQATDLQESLTQWLAWRGEDTYVEGVIDDLDLFEDEAAALGSDPFCTSAAHASAWQLQIYKYEREHLTALHGEVLERFADKVRAEISSLPTASWQEGWKESFVPIRAGRLWIYPPWEVPPLSTSDIAVEIEPGMAFGTGQHATTQLCLEALDGIAEKKILSPSARVLDWGTGSGILAIAAKRLGFATVDACDCDPDAIRAAEANALRNDVDMKLWQSFEPYTSGQNRYPIYDLLFANILAKVLLPNLVHLDALMHRRSICVLSGILSEQADEIADAAGKLEWVETARLHRDDWVAMVFQTTDTAARNPARQQQGV